MKKAIIVLQSRTNSKRLPGKALKELQGIPLVAHCIRRLKNVHPMAKLVLATSSMAQDDEIARVAATEGVDCFRGSEDDVLDRIYKAACQYEAGFIVRATGDNPLVDGTEARRVLEEALSGRWDYVCGFKEADGLVPPIGVAVEAFTFEALESAWANGKRHEHREHINDYFFDNCGQFRIKYLPCLPYNHCPGLSLTVDTIDDFNFIEDIARGIKKPLEGCATREIIEWWGSNKMARGKR